MSGERVPRVLFSVNQEGRGHTEVDRTRPECANWCVSVQEIERHRGEMLRMAFTVRSRIMKSVQYLYYCVCQYVINED